LRFQTQSSLVKESLPTRHRTVILPTSKLPECNALNYCLTANIQNPGFLQLLNLKQTSNHPQPSACSGGASRDRTDDIQLAKLALSQLSYGPAFLPALLVVGLTRLELVTPRLSSVCSNQLSYRPASGQPLLLAQQPFTLRITTRMTRSD
jgi:hypothetical protein